MHVFFLLSVHFSLWWKKTFESLDFVEIKQRETVKNIKLASWERRLEKALWAFGIWSKASKDLQNAITAIKPVNKTVLYLRS